LVPFHDSSFDHEHGVAFATMEALVGEDLWSRLRRGPMPSNEVLDLMTRLLEGLAACHERGIAHRDLHPGNIFLETTSSGSVRVRLLDFGLCAVVGRPRVTRSTTGVGHMLYACPTQLIGAADAGHAQGDVWSVGVVLYECLTGRHPFECDNDAGAVIRAATQPHVAAVERGVEELSALIDECLQKVPESRPGDAGALLVKLQAIAQRRVG
jgi:serine/threonine-protein kinase